MILITGASGHLGSRIAELLTEQGQKIRLMTRNIDKVSYLKGAEVVIADYTNLLSLSSAFTGIDTAFIVSVYGKQGERAKLHKNAIEAAAVARVNHIVYLSFQGASPESKFPMARDHYQTELYLAESGIKHTVLRNNLYLDVIPEFFNEEGLLRGPAGNGKAAWVTREDAARVVAASLIDPDKYQGIYNVTGPESLTPSETAKRMSVLVGRELNYVNESLEEGRKWRSKLGAPDWEVESWLGSYKAIEAGELEKTSNTVYQFTGRKPMNIESYFKINPHLLAPLQSK